MQIIAAVCKSVQFRADQLFVYEARPVLDLLRTEGAQERLSAFNRDVTVQGQKKLGEGRLIKMQVELDRGSDFPGLIVGKESRPKQELIDMLLRRVTRIEAEAEVGCRGIDIMSGEAGNKGDARVKGGGGCDCRKELFKIDPLVLSRGRKLRAEDPRPGKAQDEQAVIMIARPEVGPPAQPEAGAAGNIPDVG